jgi:hypothetical protein
MPQSGLYVFSYHGCCETCGLHTQCVNQVLFLMEEVMGKDVSGKGGSNEESSVR